VVVSAGVHQVLAGAAPRDAITHHALVAQDLLRGRGLRSEIFVEDGHIHSGLGRRVHSASAWEAHTRPRDAAILHYSIASAAFELVAERCDRCAIHYHNITPPELLWRYAPQIAFECAMGRRALRRFSDRVAAAGADSAYNAQELAEFGFSDPSVLGILRPPLPAAPVAPRLADGPSRILFVGRGVPNKAQHHLVLAAAALSEAGLDHELVLVGTWAGAPTYEAHCRRLARDLDVVERVHFAGSVSEEELARCYAEADLFLCLSDHEGFCVPLIEAMWAGLPIVAYASSAVPETAGEAALLLNEKPPSLVAEAVSEALCNPALAARMAAGRAERLRVLAEEDTESRVVAFAEALT
jgi:glycosyltransferase involved in cell wall biosynthesis